MLTTDHKESIKRRLVSCLQGEPEIKKIVVFGSFLERPDPNDLDVAVFQDSSETYLPLALKYRQRIRAVTREIPVDIFPIRPGARGGFLLAEIEQGEVLYEG